MASASTLTTVAYIFKKMYGEGVGDAASREHPLFNNIRKVNKFRGESFKYSVKYGNPQGIGATVALAQTGAASSKGLQFEALRFKKYGIITLDGEALAAAEGDDGALIELVTAETDGIINELVDSLAYDLYRDGTGKRGRRLSASTNAITMTVADDARNFKVGMTVMASPNANGGSPRTGTTTVAAVDEDNGIVTLTSAAAIASFADNDFLFRSGDPLTCIEGLETCTPISAPLNGDLFRTKDRSVDPSRLAGSRVSDLTNVIEENAGLVAVKLNQRGRRAREYYLNPVNFYQVVKRQGAKVEYQGGGGTADIFFETFSLHTTVGTLKVFSDPDCPVDRGRVVNPDDQYLRILRDYPHIIMDDGLRSLRQTADDGIEVRARAMGNLIQKNTASQGVHAI
ncbi:MAG TPA: hypothetical protein VJU58_04110 [Microbacterium sp.]|nr:hypothetical protein [Microbacterium sp.]